MKAEVTYTELQAEAWRVWLIKAAHLHLRDGCVECAAGGCLAASRRAGLATKASDVVESG